MTQFITFLAKNWKVVIPVLAVIGSVVFFKIQLAIADGRYKEMTKLRDAAIVSADKWHDATVKFKSALVNLEADKQALQSKLDLAKESEKKAVETAAYNAAEAQRVLDVLRQIEESSNDPVYSVRIRSHAVDFLRQRQQAAGASSGNSISPG